MREVSGGFIREGSERQIGMDPELSRAREAKPRRKPMKEEVVINCVKCSGDVHETETRNMLIADGRDQFMWRLYRTL